MHHASNRRTRQGSPAHRVLRVCVLVTVVAGAVACSGYRDYHRAQVAETEGDWDAAVLHYMELVQQNPGDLRYRSALLRAKLQASHQHFEQAKEYRAAGLLRQAMVELNKAVQLDPTNQYAMAELAKVRAEVEAERNGVLPSTIEEMKERTRGSTGQPPVLNPRSNEPIDLDFPEPVSIQKIYQALGRAFGINVLFDPKLRDQEISITLREVNAQDALEILMRTAGHFYKVLDEHSIIVVADTPQNRRNYEDLIIQTFFLSNSDVKDVMAMLRSLVDARKIASNEKLNAIILRDTADKVKIAERIIQANDKAKAELVVDVELLLLNTNALRDLGLSLNNYSVGWQIDTGGEETSLRFSDLEFLNENDWSVTVPSFVFDFLKENSDAQTLAKPQLRISEGERARLRIGDRVPVPVTSFNTANTVGSNVVPLTSFQYQDVGIIIEVEPRVHHNEEVSLQVSVEVSNIAGSIDSQPIIGTRNIETTIRLKDGETNFLAGLLRTDETNSESGPAGLSEIPLLGRLFSSKRTESQRTDIVLTLTPHIIRRADITEEDLTPIWVGTEANLTFRGGSPRIESDVEGPFDEDIDADSEDPQERMRRRLQQLPRGLRDQGADQEAEPAAPPGGVDLVPSSPNRSPFGRREPEPEPEPPPDEPPLLGALAPRDGITMASETTPASALALERALAAQTAAYDDPSLGRSLMSILSSDTSHEPQARVEEAPAEELTTRGAQPVQLRLVPQGLQVAPGDVFDIDLEAQADLPISHAPYTLRFDPEVLELLQVDDGGFFGDAAEVMSDVSTPGRLVVGASRIGAVPGVAGSGSITTMRFRAKRSGRSSLIFEKMRVLDEFLAPFADVEAAEGLVVVSRARAKTPAERERPPVARERPSMRDQDH